MRRPRRLLVFFGVCDEAVRAFERAGLRDRVEWSDRIWFTDGRGAPFWIRPTPPPGPLRFAPDLSHFRVLTPRERLAVVRALARIVRGRAAPPPGMSLAEYLRSIGVPPRAGQRLFRPLIEVAFDESPTRVDATVGTAWLRAFFSRSSRTARMGVWSPGRPAARRRRALKGSARGGRSLRM